jgi:hypothetical protein
MQTRVGWRGSQKPYQTVRVGLCSRCKPRRRAHGPDGDVTFFFRDKEKVYTESACLCTLLRGSTRGNFFCQGHGLSEVMFPPLAGALELPQADRRQSKQVRKIFEGVWRHVKMRDGDGPCGTCLGYARPDVHARVHSPGA